MSGNRWLASAIAILVLCLPPLVAVQSADDARRPAGKQWPAVSGDWGNPRHSALNQIETASLVRDTGMRHVLMFRLLVSVVAIDARAQNQQIDWNASTT